MAGNNSNTSSDNSESEPDLVLILLVSVLLSISISCFIFQIATYKWHLDFQAIRFIRLYKFWFNSSCLFIYHSFPITHFFVQQLFNGSLCLNVSWYRDYEWHSFYHFNITISVIIQTLKQKQKHLAKCTYKYTFKS